MGFLGRIFGRGSEADHHVSPALKRSDPRPEQEQIESQPRPQYTIKPEEYFQVYSTLNQLLYELKQVKARVKSIKDNSTHTLNGRDRDLYEHSDEKVRDLVDKTREAIENRLKRQGANFLPDERVYVIGQDERELRPVQLGENQNELRLVQPLQPLLNREDLLRDQAAGGPVGAVYSGEPGTESRTEGPVIQRTMKQSSAVEDEKPAVLENTNITYVVFGGDPSLREKQIENQHFDERGNLKKDTYIVDYGEREENGELQVYEKQRTRYEATNNEPLQIAEIIPSEETVQADAQALAEVRDKLQN